MSRGSFLANSVFGFLPSLRRDQDLIRQSINIYHSVRTQALRKGFKLRGSVKDNFKATHSLIATHVWLLHKRLLKEGSAGKALDRALFERFWEDTTSRIRFTDVPELTVDGHLSNVQKYSFENMALYDHCLTYEEESERILKLCGGIWRFVYDMEESVQEPTAIEFARYLMGELETLDGIPLDALKDGRIEWRRPPKFLGEGNSASTEVTTKGNLDYIDTRDEVEQFESPWRLEWTLRGDTYFWNEENAEVLWDLDPTLVWKGTSGDGSIQRQAALMSQRGYTGGAPSAPASA
mmetsp:Transcript_410/g.1530  ORF Transcript_410/g.1530 Transcript_410/m.1530 type:complete len:293 (-) Transcript_410:134-1012(-)